MYRCLIHLIASLLKAVVCFAIAGYGSSKVCTLLITLLVHTWAFTAPLVSEVIIMAALYAPVSVVMKSDSVLCIMLPIAH